MGRRCQSQCHASDASAHQLASRHLAGAKSRVGWANFTRWWMSRFARQKWTNKAPMCPMPCNAVLKGCPLPDQSLNGLYCDRLLWSLYAQAKLKERNPKWNSCLATLQATSKLKFVPHVPHGKVGRRSRMIMGIVATHHAKLPCQLPNLLVWQPFTKSYASSPCSFSCNFMRA